GIPYPSFILEPKMPRDSLQMWLPGLFEPGASSQKASELVERERMPRDLMLHGRLDEATNVLITIRDELRRQRSVPITPELGAAVGRWCDLAVEVYGNYLRLEKESKDPKSKHPVDPGALESAKQTKAKLWAQGQAVYTLIQRASAEYMAGEVTYLVA